MRLVKKLFMLPLLVLLLGACASQTPELAHSDRFLDIARNLPLELLEETRLRTVRIAHAKIAPPRALGTGVIVAHRGSAYILTAYHVLSTSIPPSSGFALLQPNIPGLAVEFHDGSRAPIDRAMVIAKTDIAIIGPIATPEDVSKVRFLDLGAMSDALPGEPLLIWGSPFGYGPTPFLGTLAYRMLYRVDDAAGRGIIVAIVPKQDSMELALDKARDQNSLLGFQSAAGVAPGVSGGPAFDDKGRLFGLIGFGAQHTGDPAASRAMGVVSRSVLDQILTGIDLLQSLPAS